MAQHSTAVTRAKVIQSGAPDAINRAAEILRNGGIVAIPTDTVYGLAVLPQPAPLERLVAAKRRSIDKGIQLLIDSVDQMHLYAAVPEQAERLAARYWPGPLTLVLQFRPGVTLPELLSGGRGTVGLRLPDHEVPRGLCRILGPIAASSANVSGRPDATTAQQALASMGSEFELMLDDGPVRGGMPSTVVAFDGQGSEPVILREGALSRADILAAAG